MNSCVVMGSDLMESGPVGSMHRLARDVSSACKQTGRAMICSGSSVIR